MNRNITLIVSVVVVIVLLVIWLYLMFFASPSQEPGPIEGSGTYSELGGLGEDAAGAGGNGSGGENGQGAGGMNGGEEYNPDILRQLTTRNVIGYREVEIASTTHIVYMESGVGHIYSIDLATGVENRMSATTIPDAREAQFSSDASFVAVKTKDDAGAQTLSLATVSTTIQSVTLEEIEKSVAQFKFSASDALMYTVVKNGSVSAVAYDLSDQTTSALFDTPFREAVISLGNTLSGPHYFWPKTSHLLEGFVYQVSAGSLKRLPVDGYGFSANIIGDHVVTSYREQTKLFSHLYNAADNSFQELTTTLIPGKCTGGENLYCAIPQNTTLKYNDIDQWYQGTESFSDNLWQIGETSNTPLINITSHSGRNVDVINGNLGDLSSDWYFQNKFDNSLWIYELSRLNSEENDSIETEEVLDSEESNSVETEI